MPRTPRNCWRPIAKSTPRPNLARPRTQLQVAFWSCGRLSCRPSPKSFGVGRLTPVNTSTGTYAIGRIIRGAGIGALAGAITLWVAGLIYACCAAVLVCFTEPRPGERLLGVFLFCFVLLGLFWGSILGGISGALGGGLGGWSIGRSRKLRWRTVVAFGGFGNLALVVLVFMLVDHLPGPTPIRGAPLPVRVLKLLPALASIAAVGMPPMAIGYATARTRLRRAEANVACVQPPRPPAA